MTRSPRVGGVFKVFVHGGKDTTPWRKVRQGNPAVIQVGNLSRGFDTPLSSQMAERLGEGWPHKDNGTQ